MTPAPLPLNESERLEALRRYYILDTPPEESFERVVRLAREFFGVPVALITFVDSERQWFKACYGLDHRESSREVSFCAHAILSPNVMVVPDATLDARFFDNPDVLGGIGIRFYAGAPLKTPGGYNLGTLCIIDTRSRPPLEPRQEETLADLAAIVIDELELRRSLSEVSAEVTRRQQAEQDLLEANLVLASASRSKSNFLATMSHELRTPLTAILGFSELLAEETFGPLNRKQKQYAQDIHEAGHHLLSLINDILDISKIEAGKMELWLEPVYVEELLQGALSMFLEKAKTSGVTLEVTPPAEPFFLVADKRKLKQALFNYLSNAIKFTPAGGRVSLSVEDKGDEVAFTVQDTGIGIAEEDQDDLFQQFTQVDSSLSRQYEGTGLGLMLTKHLVELHGGRVWLESSLNEGSTFGFIVPKEAAPVARAGARESEPSSL